MGAPAIRLFGDACLRRRARAADPQAPQTRRLLDEMWDVLADDGGVGLAAPQVGRDLRVVVIRDPAAAAGEQRLELVNPVLRRTFGPDTPFEEGCLSFPGLYTVVLRPAGVEVAYDVPGDAGPRTLRDEGLVARIVQHEIDHLDGVLFIDHLSPRDRILLGPRLLLILLRRLWRGRGRPAPAAGKDG